MVSTTSWGRSPRTSASRPGTRHGVSRGLDMGAIRCPVSESVDPSSGLQVYLCRSTCASPKRRQISWTVWGWSLHSPGSTARDSSSAVRLSKPWIWMARSDLRCFRLQRRRWRASCDMQQERRPPCRMMYAMVAVLSVRTSTCSPRKRLLRWFKARCTASNSRQLMCQCSWGPVQTPDTACPLNVAPPALGGGICVNHSSAWRPVPGALLPEGMKGLTTGWRFGGRLEWLGPAACRSATPTSGLGHGASVEAVSYGAAQAALPPPQLPCAPGASETVSVVPPSCSRMYSNSSTPTERIPAWGALSDWPSPTPYREKRSSAPERVCSFPNWPEGPTGCGARGPSPCVRITGPETELV